MPQMEAKILRALGDKVYERRKAGALEYVLDESSKYISSTALRTISVVASACTTLQYWNTVIGLTGPSAGSSNSFAPRSSPMTGILSTRLLVSYARTSHMPRISHMLAMEV